MRVRGRPKGAHERIPLEPPRRARRKDAKRPHGTGFDSAKSDASRAVQPRRARNVNHGEFFFVVVVISNISTSYHIQVHCIYLFI